MKLKGLDVIKCEVCKKDNDIPNITKLKDIPICNHCGASLNTSKKRAFREILLCKIIKANKEDRENGTYL